MNEVIQILDVTKTFKLSSKQRKTQKITDKVKTAVNHLSLTTYQGEIYGLLGPNGAGKTTTLRMLSTLIKPDSGDIIIGEYNIKSNPNEIRKSIAFLTSELKLEEYFTPSYLYDFYSDLHHIDENTKKQRKQELFEKFGINEFSEVKVGELSTGMRQKASLVISLAHNPDIIIFDEPTNGLDVLTAKIVTDFLIELKSQGKSIIVSTHIFSLIEKICDRVGIIIDGKMVKEDTLDNIRQGKSLEDAFFEIYTQTVGE